MVRLGRLFVFALVGLPTLLGSCALPTTAHPMASPPGELGLAPELDLKRPDQGFLPAYFTGVKIGSLVHDAGLTGETFETGTDGNMEFLFKRTPSLPLGLGTPRPHLGVTMNDNGGTSQAYSGLTWTAPIYGSLFGGLSLGLAAHNGRLVTRRDDTKGLGSRVLFRAALELGIRLTPRHDIAIVADHVSNAGLADVNEGLDTVGIRLGYSF